MVSWLCYKWTERCIQQEKLRQVEVCSKTGGMMGKAQSVELSLGLVLFNLLSCLNHCRWRIHCCNGVTVGSFLGGLVAGVVFSLLIVGVVFGVAKLRQQLRKGSKSKEEKEMWAFLCLLPSNLGMILYLYRMCMCCAYGGQDKYETKCVNLSLSLQLK